MFRKAKKYTESSKCPRLPQKCPQDCSKRKSSTAMKYQLTRKFWATPPRLYHASVELSTLDPNLRASLTSALTCTVIQFASDPSISVTIL